MHDIMHGEALEDENAIPKDIELCSATDILLTANGGGNFFINAWSCIIFNI